MKKITNLNKKKKRLLLASFALLLLTTTALYTVFIKPNQNTEKWVYLETTVEQGDLKAGVTENGSLDFGITSQMYDLDLSTDTDEDEEDDDEEEEEETLKYLKVEDVYVVTGQRISKGDKVLKFTDKSVEAVRRKLTSAATEAEVELEEAQAEYNLSAISAKETYDLNREQAASAGSIYQYARQILQNSIAKNQTEIARLQEEITRYQENIEEAQEDYDDALKDYNTAAEDLKSVGTSNWHITIQFESSYQQAKNKKEQAETNLNNILDKIEEDQKEIETLQKQIEMDSASINVEVLEAGNNKDLAAITGNVAEEIYQAALESLKTDIDDAQEKLNILQDKLNDFEDFIGDGVIYAEGSGIVTEVGFDTGDTLEASGVLVAFAKEGEMTITVDVSQEDITSLAVGDPVEIEFSAYEGQIYEGNVLSITTTNTSSNSVTVSYPVKVSVKGDTSALYGGMSAEVIFVTKEHKDTLYVSKKAIVKQNGKTYVYIKNGSDYQLKEVETGMSNSVSTEILSGLSAGDTIYIASQVSESTKEKSSNDEDAQENTEEKPFNDESVQKNLKEEPSDIERNSMPDLESSGLPDINRNGTPDINSNGIPDINVF